MEKLNISTKMDYNLKNALLEGYYQLSRGNYKEANIHEIIKRAKAELKKENSNDD